MSRQIDGEAGRRYPDPAERVEFYLFRTPEELYDIQRDPGCLNNLADDPTYQPTVQRFRDEVLTTLKTHDDHELANYQQFLSVPSE